MSGGKNDANWMMWLPQTHNIRVNRTFHANFKKCKQICTMRCHVNQRRAYWHNWFETSECTSKKKRACMMFLFTQVTRKIFCEWSRVITQCECSLHFLCTHRYTVCNQKLPHWKWMGSEFHLVEMFGTAPKHNLTQSSFFVISTSNLEHKLLRFGFDLHAVLQ